LIIMSATIKRATLVALITLIGISAASAQNQTERGVFERRPASRGL
jgi:hypothetical protein